MRCVSELDIPMSLSSISSSNGAFFVRARISEILFVFFGMPWILAHNDESSIAT